MRCAFLPVGGLLVQPFNLCKALSFKKYFAKVVKLFDIFGLLFAELFGIIAEVNRFQYSGRGYRAW